MFIFEKMTDKNEIDLLEELFSLSKYNGHENLLIGQRRRRKKLVEQGLNPSLLGGISECYPLLFWVLMTKKLNNPKSTRLLEWTIMANLMCISLIDPTYWNSLRI